MITGVSSDISHDITECLVIINELAKTKREAFLKEKHIQRFWKAEPQIYLTIAPALATSTVPFNHGYYLHR